MNGRANIAVFHVLILFFANADCKVQQREFLKLDLEDVKLLDSVLFETEANSSIQCTTICKRTPWCRTLTVTSPPSASSVICRGHSSLVANSAVTSVSWTSVWATESAWLERACSSDVECPVAMSECFLGSCLCSPGYYYSHTQDNCTDTCAGQDLQAQRVLTYPSIWIEGRNAPEGCVLDISIEECLQVCAQNQQARTCDYSVGKGGRLRCCPQLITVLDVSGFWEVENSTHFQKTCL